MNLFKTILTGALILWQLAGRAAVCPMHDLNPGEPASGVFQSANCQIANSQSFTEQFQPNSSFNRHRANYLNPNTGRFWTMDSFEGSNEDPLSLHKYLYAHNDPIMMVDPSGHYSSWSQELGYDAEEAIDDEYRAMHVGQIGILFGGAVDYNVSGITGFLKPDIYNPNEKTFLEIKPISISGVAKGIAKIALDYGAFSDCSPDTTWQSRTALLKTPSTGTIIFVRNVGGGV